jgi:hypothetical protein
VAESDSTTASWYSANLMVRSERLTAAELANVIGMEPDQKWSKGEPRSVRRPGVLNKATSVWFRSDLPSTERMTEHVAIILSRLEPIADRIGKFAKEIVRSSGPDTCSDPWVNLSILPVFRTLNDSLSLAPDQVDLLARMGADLDASYAWDLPDVQGNGTSGYGVFRSNYNVSLSIHGERTVPDLPQETPLEKQLDWLVQTIESTEVQNVEHGNRGKGENQLHVAITSWQDEYEDYLWVLPRHLELLSRVGAGIEISFDWDHEAWTQ